MKILKRYKVNMWNNGTPSTSTGSGYGIRIGKNEYLAIKDWEELIVNNEIIYRINCKFNENCPEIRSLIIGKFFLYNKIDQSNLLFLYLVDVNKFELKFE